MNHTAGPSHPPHPPPSPTGAPAHRVPRVALRLNEGGQASHEQASCHAQSPAAATWKERVLASNTVPNPKVAIAGGRGLTAPQVTVPS